MAVKPEKTTIRISPNPPVFDLPILVAIEHGLFADAGLEVSYSAPYGDRNQRERDVLRRQKEALFTSRSADSFNVCEWGGIDRIERGVEHGRIFALRPAIVAQAIVSFDPALQTPRDLADVAVGVNEFTGSHYTTVGLLEGAVGASHVKIEHVGAPEVRLQAAKNGQVRAVTVMEPFISLAIKQGAHLIASTFYRGAEILSDDLPASSSEIFLATLDAATDLINSDFGRYAHYICAPTGGLLTPEELSRHFVRYTHAQRYSADLFSPAYEWMKDRGFTAGLRDHQDLVTVLG